MMKSIARRNDYIASIKADISDIDQRLKTIEGQASDARDLRSLARINHEWRIWRMSIFESRTLKKQAKRLQKTRKELARHLWMAENWIR